MFVSLKSCCCPSLGLDGPAGLDPVCACFLWGAETGAVFSLVSQTTGGGVLEGTCRLISMRAASFCFSVTLILILIETEKFITRRVSSCPVKGRACWLGLLIKAGWPSRFLDGGYRSARVDRNGCCDPQDSGPWSF